MQDVGTISAVSAASQAPAAVPGKKARDAQLDKVARQFEAMFMTEMVHSARPANQAAGVFAGGKSEETWQTFMDQALGQAASANGPAGDQGLHRAIVKALHDVDARAAQGNSK